MVELELLDYQFSLKVRSWPKCEAQVVRLSVSFGEIAWLFEKNPSAFDICRSHSQ